MQTENLETPDRTKKLPRDSWLLGLIGLLVGVGIGGAGMYAFMTNQVSPLITPPLLTATPGLLPTSSPSLATTTPTPSQQFFQVTPTQLAPPTPVTQSCRFLQGTQSLEITDPCPAGYYRIYAGGESTACLPIGCPDPLLN